MRSHTEALEAFADGQMVPEDAERFRDHLVGCEQCQAALLDVMNLRMLGEAHHQQPPMVALVRPRRRSIRYFGWAAAGAAVLAAVVLATLKLSNSPQTREPIHFDDSLWSVNGGRVIEERLAYPRASAYRKRTTVMSASGNSHAAPSSEVAHQLEAGRDYAGSAALYLSGGDRGDVKRALEALSMAPPSLAVENDKAVAYLLRNDAALGDLAEALKVLTEILEKDPKHRPALWNRALALERLGLPLSAAKVFAEVAAMDEAEWAKEAVDRVGILRPPVENRRKTWSDALDVGRKLIKTGEFSRPELVERAPILRLYFYDAVRTRLRPAELAALKPLATLLDAQAHSLTLTNYLAWVEKRDFGRRGRLAKAYARFLADEGKYKDLQGGEGGRLIRDALVTGEWDLFLGFVVMAGKSDLLLNEFVREANRSRDPWFVSLAAQQEARAAMDRGDLNSARDKLKVALGSCGIQGIEFRCLSARLQAAEQALSTGDLSGAVELARDGWTAAEQAGDWGKEKQFCQELAQIARLRNDAPLARAYLGEALEQVLTSGDREAERFVRSNLAFLDASNLSLESARHELEESLAVDPVLDTMGILALGDIIRVRRHPTPKESDAVRGFERQINEFAVKDRALALHALGRFYVEVDQVKGIQYLRQAIDAASGPAANEPNNHRARTYSFTSLIMEAAGRRAYGEVFELLAQEHKVTLAPTCTVAFTADSERALTVLRDAGGEVQGFFEPSRTSIVGDRLSGMLPPSATNALRACEFVTVIARAPYFGVPGLLPDDMAWTFRLLEPRDKNVSVAEAGTLLSVQNVAYGASWKGLPALAPWHATFVDSSLPMVVLTGNEATPRRVQAEMEKAVEIDLATHGLVNPASSEAYLVLASEGGEDRLTAKKIAQLHLARHPMVVLAACHAGHVSPTVYEPLSLPAAFLRAGARGVLASTAELPDQDAQLFFAAVRERIAHGAKPAVALRDERMRFLREGKGKGWVENVLAFE